MRALISLLLILLTVLIVCDVSNAQESRRRPGRRFSQNKNRERAQRTFKSEPIQTGFLVIDGQLIDLPYQVEWDGKSVHINGSVLEQADGYRVGQRICSVLNDSNIEIICNGTAKSISISSDEGDAFLRWVSEPEKSESDLDSIIVALKKDLDPKILRGQFLALSASSESIARARENLSIIDNIHRANVTVNQAVSRLQKLSYPLTMLGMVLTVIAFGHLLSHRPDQTIATTASANVSPEATRMVTRSIIFVVLLSSLDLVWTILAFQAGQMKELNPLASQLLHDPKQLVAFKAMATFTGAGLLLLLKKHRPAQMASWWMCLVCTVLTFRWITFNSLMMG